MPRQDDTNWGPLLGIGLQVLAGALLGLVVGQWLDRKFGWAPWGTLAGVGLGLAAGTYSLIKEGMRVNRDPPKPGAGKPPRND